MLKTSRSIRWSSIGMGIAAAVLFAAPAHAESMVLKKGTEVKLVFDSPLNSKTARIGDRVQFHVEEPVLIDGKTVIPEGAKTSGTVEKVNKRGRYGVNARVRLQMDPLPTTARRMAPLGFKTEGPLISGKTGGAAAATVGGAIVLGPVGLIGGYFIPGKTVDAKPGDVMTVQIDRDTMLHWK